MSIGTRWAAVRFETIWGGATQHSVETTAPNLAIGVRQLRTHGFHSNDSGPATDKDRRSNARVRADRCGNDPLRR